MIDDVRVEFAELPTSIGGYVISDSDDFYTIILNSKLSHEQNMKSYEHELEHIFNGDFDKSSSADEIENQAHHL